ncbi:MAG: DUF2182 domain-containing protein [Pseudomonadota bacterium]
MLASRIRAMTAPHWLALFAAVMASWVLIYVTSVPLAYREFTDIYGAEFLASLCLVTPDVAGFFRSTAMWALMSAAMMVPSALPAIATYDDLTRAAGRPGIAGLLAGYMSVWLGFSVVAALLQLALLDGGLIDVLGQSRSALFTAGLLAFAGVYQFSSLKAACLRQCRTPLSFFMERWDDGAFRNGVHLGVVCLGCCWALMLLAFVGGTMSLAFMGLAMVLMTFEKLPEFGRLLTFPVGIALIFSATWSMVLAF